MSAMGRRIARVALLTVVAAALGVGVTLAVRPDPQPREIVLTARGMAFYVDGDDRPNPALRVRPGEYVRFVLRNEAPGFVHDLAIPEMNVSLEPIAAGQSRATVVRVPALTGPVRYVCRPHERMMSGTIVPAGP